MASVEALIRCQRALKRQLGKLELNISDGSSKTVAQWKSLQDTLEENKRDFLSNQELIFDAISGDEERMNLEETVQDDFTDKYTELILTVREKIRELSASGSTSSDQQHPLQGSNPHVDDTLVDILNEMMELHRRTATPGRYGGVKTKLPPLELPTFDGDYSHWQSFKDAYVSSIHNNDDLTAGQKMQYLKSKLTGDAAKYVEFMKITDDNYINLWETLQDKYGKKIHIVNDCIEKFLAQEKMKEGSLESLKDLTLNSKRILWELKKMGDEYFTLDSWIIFLMRNLMDEDTRKSWEESRLTSELATVDEWFNFLDKRISAMELWKKKSTQPNVKSEKKPQSQAKSSVKSHHTETAKCPKCSASHQLYQCDAFKAMTPQEKRRLVFSARLCYNCLRANHIVERCPSESTCRQCDQKHHTLLHPCEVRRPATDSQGTEKADVSKVPPNPPEVKKETITTHHSTTNQRVLLPTALVNVDNAQGKQQVCRILIDGGGECTLISESCAQRLGLPRRRARIAVNGAAEVTVGHTRGLVSLVLSSLYHPEEHIQAEAYVLSKLTTLLPSSKIVEPDTWKHLKTLQLADPSFNTPGNIDIILGAEHAMSINLPQMLHGEAGVPVAQLTIFGWILGGKIGGESNTITSFHTTQSLDAALSRFWEVDHVIPKAKILSEEEKYCEEHFVENVQRNEDGRYQVRLPFKKSHAELGESKSAALRRLQSMEKKFGKDPEFHEKYAEFMREYLTMGHMEEVPADDVPIENSKSYVIPHMAVLRPTSTTTKLRVVFDASARTKPHNVSLNDALAVGPTIQQDLVSLLLNFRVHKYAFSADVEKMYRQVVVAPQDRDYQRILWRESPKEPIRTYRLTTVTYGTSCAPYLATRVLHQMALDNEEDCPEASQAIRNGFYMDDLMGGAETWEAAMKLRDDIQNILANGGFHLRKWCSNSVDILRAIPSSDLAVSPEEVTSCSKTVSTLGLKWSPGEDTLAIALESMQEATTKRELCASAAKIFDPLGIIAPVTAAMKMIFQKLWTTDLGWDDELPADILEEFNEIRDELESLEQVKISRLIPLADSQIELHGFCDASERGYGAVLYVRGLGQDNEVVVRFLISKSRVAPLKPLSIPRLELCAALLLSRLYEKVREAYTAYSVTITAWTDSMVVLHWLQQHPSKWKTYVANRTDEILETIPAIHWRHVSSGDNPADCISRGLSPKQLIQHTLYWFGPAWLKEGSDRWPETKSMLKSDTVTGEEKSPMIQSLVVQKSSDFNDFLFNKFSSVSQLIRVVAYILRWSRKNTGIQSLLVKELDSARYQLIRMVQRECFPEELKCLNSGKELNSGSKLAKLLPYLDSDGIIRVKGRIQNSELGFDTRHPIVLPGKHIFTQKVIESAHVSHMHSGLTLTQSVLRARYWIIGERNSVKSVIHKCIQCFKAKPKAETPLMGNLPAVRVRPARAFVNTGCDFAGPFVLRASKLRKAVRIKGYICLFICMATKAVHLEVVSDLSTDAFVAALRRFTARRGHCEHLYCDNASNFLGAVQAIGGEERAKRVRQHQDKIVKFMSESGTQFHFIPAYSPTFGGLWERGIGSVKSHLKRVLSDTILTFEEMVTVVTEIEACLNSRPLCQLSSDPEDLQALTPGHFLIGQPLTLPPSPNFLDVNPNRLTRWNSLQRLTQEFWKRWHNEYVTSLQQRPKWLGSQENLQIGDLVLVKSENFKTGSWTLGRVFNVHPGADGVVRVVTVKTRSGMCRRGVNKLARLPID